MRFVEVINEGIKVPINLIKKVWYSPRTFPGYGVLFFGIVLIEWGYFATNSFLNVVTIAGFFVVGGIFVWLKETAIEIGPHFQGLRPVLPFNRISIVQKTKKCDRSEKRKTCPAIWRELATESEHMADYLPIGRYQAITHDVVISRLKKYAEVSFDASPKPVYMGGLRLELLDQTHWKCLKCQNRCKPWKTSVRQFYFIKFTVQHV